MSKIEKLNINKTDFAESEVVLECSNVAKSYKEANNELKVLCDVNVKINLGEQIAILGRSGSGKTTLLQLLGGLDTPSNGKVKFLGYDWKKISEAKKLSLRNKSIGFIYQLHHLLPEFTALENVAMPLLLRNIPIKDIEHKAKELLKRVGLKSRMEHKPSELSGGERQRVAIARALISEPKCVLADEPTGNLDLENAKAIFELMREINKEFRTTFIIVTHDLELANKLDRSYKLINGKLTKN